MTDKNEALKAEPNYDEILKGKIDYYGETKAAYQLAAEEYARQVKSYHSEPLIKEIGELKTELDEFREAAIIDIKENHSLEQQIDALKKENERWKTEVELREHHVMVKSEIIEKLESELTALKSQKEPLMEGVKSAEDFAKEEYPDCDSIAGIPLARMGYVAGFKKALQFKQSQEGKQVDVEAIGKEFNKWWNEQAVINYFAIWNFFLPFLQSGEGREIEFAEWTHSNGWRYESSIKKWYNYYGQVMEETTDKLFKMFLNPKV